MPKVVSSYVNDEAAQRLAEYCRFHHCTQSSALGSLLHECVSGEPFIRIVKDPTPIGDAIDRAVDGIVSGVMPRA